MYYARILLPLFLLISLVSAKICWQKCSDQPDILSGVDIVGCRRRPIHRQRGQWRFRCKGSEGPPCIVKRGDTVRLKVEFSPDKPIATLRQEAHWITSAFPIPWAGLDNDACKYLSGNCLETDRWATLNSTSSPTLSFDYPIQIMSFYPPTYYNLRWKFATNGPDGTQHELSCFQFAIKIT